jgi:hypothetical protein
MKRNRNVIEEHSMLENESKNSINSSVEENVAIKIAMKFKAAERRISMYVSMKSLMRGF